MAIPDQIRLQAEGLNAAFLAVSNNAPVVAAAYCFLGFSLLAWSMLLGNFSVTFDGTLSHGITVLDYPAGFDKEVGYAFAPNWGLTGALLLPVVFFFCLTARSLQETTLEELVRHGMIIRSDGNAATIEEVLAFWRPYAGLWTMVALSVFFVVALFVVWDFYEVVFRPLWEPVAVYPDEVAKFVDPVNEFDWSVAALYPKEHISVLPNVAFSACAYAYVAVLGAGSCFAAFFFFIGFASFLHAPRMKKLGLRIVPNLDSKDKKNREGFELFEDYFNALIFAATGLLLILYFMYVQNIFLRDTETSNIADLIVGNPQPILDMFNGTIDIGAIKDWIVELPVIDKELSLFGNVTSVLGAMIAPFVILCVALFSYFVLRSTAKSGADYLRRIHTEAPGTASEQTIKELDEMVFWPVGWISLNNLLAACIGILLAFVAFRLIGLLLVYIFFRFALTLWPSR